MRKLTFVLTVFLSISLLFSTEVKASKIEVKHEAKADELKALGLFQGTAKGYELDRAPTRAEGVVMLIRLLGKEKEAREANLSHFFDDVPAWASQYVAYAYHNNLSKGIDKHLFGSSDPLTLQQFSTFILRALGYDDTKGDFSWRSAAEKMNELGIISEAELKNLKTKTFLRDDVVLLSYYGLHASMKDGNKLIDYLSLNGNNPNQEVPEDTAKKVVKLNATALPELTFEVESYASAKAYIFPHKLSAQLKDLKTFTAVKYNLLIDAERFIQSLTNNEAAAREEIDKFSVNTTGTVKDGLLSSNIVLYPHVPGQNSSYSSTDPEFDTYVILVFENHNNEIFAYSYIHAPYNSVTENIKTPIKLSNVPNVSDMYVLEDYIVAEPIMEFKSSRYYTDKVKYDEYITKYGKPVFSISFKSPNLLNINEELSYKDLKKLDATKMVFNFESKYPALVSSSWNYSYQYIMHLDADMNVLSYAALKLKIVNL